MQMIAVVGGITGNDQTNGRNVKAGCASSVGVSEWYTDQIVPFQVNDVSGQLFGNCKMAGNLAGKTRIPKRSERLWRCLLAHNLNHIRPRDKAGTWKSLQNCTGAKEMIPVAMGGVDRRQILSARHNPIRQGARLLDRNGGVEQESVALTRNKRRRNRRPRPLFFAWRQIARDSGYAGRQKHVPPQGFILSCTSGVGGTAVGLAVSRPLRDQFRGHSIGTPVLKSL